MSEEIKHQYALLLNTWGIQLFKVVQETERSFRGVEYFGRVGYGATARVIVKEDPLTEALVILDDEDEAKRRYEAAKAHGKHLDETLIKPLNVARRDATMRWSTEVVARLKGEAIPVIEIADAPQFSGELDALALRWFENGTPVAQIISTLRAEITALQALCEDEGCPHHGTPHVCVSPSATAEPGS